MKFSYCYFFFLRFLSIFKILRVMIKWSIFYKLWRRTYEFYASAGLYCKGWKSMVVRNERGEFLEDTWTLSLRVRRSVLNKQIYILLNQEITNYNLNYKYFNWLLTRFRRTLWHLLINKTNSSEIREYNQFKVIFLEFFDADMSSYMALFLVQIHRGTYVIVPNNAFITIFDLIQ